MCAHRRDSTSQPHDDGRRARALPNRPRLEHTRHRLEHLYEISKLFVGFESIDRTFDAALAIAARTLPIVSAVLIDEGAGAPRMVIWPSEGGKAEAVKTATANAEKVYGYLRGVSPDEIDARVVAQAGATILPRALPSENVEALLARSIVIPLVVGRGPIFGALQLEATDPLDESDVMFVSAVANQLAVALDRRHAWNRVIEQRDLAEARLGFARAITASLGEGVVAVDVHGCVTFVNGAATRMLDRDRGKVEGKPLSDLIPLEASDGSPVELRLAPVLRTGHPVREDGHLLVGSDGSKVPVSYTIAPIRDGASISGAVVGLEDISLRRRAEQDQRCLLEASKILGAALDSPTRLEELARLLVPRLGEYCFVDLIEDDTMVRTAAAHVDPSKAKLVRRGAGARVELGDHPAADVVRRNQSVLVASALEVWLAHAPMGDDHRELLRELGARSLLMVPMRIGARMMGTLTFAFAESGRRHDASDVALAEELAQRIAFAVENDRLYARALRQTQMREQILGVVSHDLRNPLNTMTMATGILSDIEVLPGHRDAFDRALGALTRGLSTTRRLIDDLLDFASAEAGRLSLELQRLDPAKMLREAGESLEILARAKGVRLEIHDEPGLPRVLGDRDRVLQVIANLASNAIKVSAPGDVVELRAVEREHDVLFSVKDTGPGIREADLQHLFERYWRSSDARYKGSGLGLAIAQGIVGAHNGEIWAESTVGVGSTFFFTLPVQDRRAQ